MSLIEVMMVVADHLDPDYFPALETVERWRSRCLSIFERDCHVWNTGRDYEAKRRTVINGTFERLIEIVRSRMAGNCAPADGA